MESDSWRPKENLSRSFSSFLKSSLVGTGQQEAKAGVLTYNSRSFNIIYVYLFHWLWYVIYRKRNAAFDIYLQLERMSIN